MQFNSLFLVRYSPGMMKLVQNLSIWRLLSLTLNIETSRAQNILAKGRVILKTVVLSAF